jgi:hypothetical protein
MYQQDRKAQTILRIIGELQKRGFASRSALATALSLYTSTVSIRMKELLDWGIIREVGRGESGSSGGRKATLVELDPGYGSFGGIYLAHDRVTASLFTPGLQESDRRTLSLAGMGEADVLTELAEVARWLGSASSTIPLRGIGFAASSVVSGGGRVGSSSHFPWNLGEVPGLLADQAHCSLICSDNDANAAALADASLLDSERPNLLHLLVYGNVPTIGSGIFLDGRLYRGSEGGAGELDEGLWPLEGDIALQVLRLGRLLGRFLDVDAIFISGVLDEEAKRRLERSGDAEAPKGSVRFVDDPCWVEKGAALMALHEHIEIITGVKHEG